MSELKTRMHNGYKQYYDGEKWVYTHRRVAEKELGAPIPEGNEVHHINKDTTDNRPENLMVLDKETHREIHNREREDAKEVTTLQDNPLDAIKKVTDALESVEKITRFSQISVPTIKFPPTSYGSKL